MLLGIETEYALSASGDVSAWNNRERLAAALLDLARKQIPNLPDWNAPGIYLQNASRLYIDCGAHPELSTPECTSPADVVRYALAGERILVELMADFGKRHPGATVSLTRCNVDYSGSQNTWGCHESYLHRSQTAHVEAQIVPHLVTRLVYTGAGGFDNRCARPRFLLSPRVTHLQRPVSNESTHERGIFHTKNEPLCSGGYRRLHILCGESLCSQLASYLKVGTTALIVRLIDAGVCGGDGLTFMDPVKAMRRFAADPSCRRKATLESRRRVTAIDVQRHYLENVEAQLGASFLPPWAYEVCRVWRAVLDRLEKDPESLSTTLDWCIKLALFRDWARGRGVDWDQVPNAPELRAPLCEIDTRFGRLGPHGIFEALEGAGALDQRLARLGSVSQAVSEPPAGSRAQARGRAVRELQGHGRYRACWEGILEPKTGRFLDMSDPFDAEPSWRERPVDPVARSDRGDSRNPVADSFRRVTERLLAQRARRRPPGSDGDSTPF